MYQTEKTFSAVELEALALLSTVEHFRFYLSGRRSTLFTDHSALTHIVHGDAPTAKLSRWQEKLSEFDCEIVQVEDSHNLVVDALSRQSWPSLPDYKQQKFQMFLLHSFVKILLRLEHHFSKGGTLAH